MVGLVWGRFEWLLVAPVGFGRVVVFPQGLGCVWRFVAFGLGLMDRRFGFLGLSLDVVGLDMAVCRFDCCLDFRVFDVGVVGLYMVVSFGLLSLRLFVVWLSAGCLCLFGGSCGCFMFVLVLRRVL